MLREILEEINSNDLKTLKQLLIDEKPVKVLIDTKWYKLDSIDDDDNTFWVFDDHGNRTSFPLTEIIEYKLIKDENNDSEKDSTQDDKEDKKEK